MSTPEGAFKTKMRECFLALFPPSQHSMTGAIGVALGQPSGLPDRYFGAGGGFAWVEAKVAGKHVLTPIQKLQLTRLANCGQNAYLFTLRHYDQDRSIWRMTVDRFIPDQVPGKTELSLDVLKDLDFWLAILNPPRHPGVTKSW